MLFFFVGQVSRSGDMQEVWEDDFGDDNASGCVILNRVRGPRDIPSEICPFRRTEPPHFAHFALVYIQAPTLNACGSELTVGNFEIN